MIFSAGKKGALLLTALVMPVFLASSAQARDFDSWLRDLRQEAIRYGISSALVNQALPDDLELDERIIRLDHKQPEGGISFEKYKNNVVTPSRIKLGRALMKRNEALLKKVEQSYGVPAQYIVALWGLETSYGQNMGGFETIPALVTLSYDARRSDFFRQELLKALKIVDDGDVSLHKMRGSWAGAMGQCQFMPTSFQKYAQDFDNDGKKDIWGSKADVFASTAAYLSESGWVKGEPWGFRVNLPKNFDFSEIGPKVQKSAEQWRALGIKVPDAFKADEPLSLVQSGGAGYKTYIVGTNYRILLKWNTSTYFATAAGLLADQLKS